MNQSGDWITPRLNGFKYFEKPALQYWASAVIFKVFGQSNFTARAWPAFFGLLGAFWIYYLGSTLFGRREGFFSCLILCSSTLYFCMSHMLTLDLAVSVFMMLGMGGVLLAQNQRSSPTAVRNWMLLSWAFFACAVLTKGLVGIVLPAAATVIYSLWQRDWSLWRHLHIAKGLTLFLVITAPWFITVSVQNDEFFQFFFIHEHFERYTTTTHNRNGPVYYFIPIFLVGIFPWITSSLRALTSVASPTIESNETNRFDPIRFLWTYCAFVFVFFSIGSSKLPPYILPIMPAVALLSGRILASSKTLKFDGWIMVVFAACLAVASFWIPELSGNAYYDHYRPWVLGAAVFFLLGGVTLIRLQKQLLRSVTITTLL